MDLCSTLPSSPSHSWYFQRSLVILQALSLSAKTTKLSPVTLQALSLSCQSHLLANQNYNSSMHCTATKPHAAQLLTLISYAHHSCKRLNFSTFVTCQKMLSLRKLNLNAHSNLSELCDIDQVCGLSIPRIGTVARFPGSSSYPWAWVLCLVDWHSTARPRSMAKAIPTKQSLFVSGVWCSSIFHLNQSAKQLVYRFSHCTVQLSITSAGTVIHSYHRPYRTIFPFEPQRFSPNQKSNGEKPLKLMEFPGSCRSLYSSKHHTCVSRIYSQLQPTNLTHSSLYLSPGKLSNLSLSKHLTRASRTHSQPQPVEISSMLISRQVVGVFNVQTPRLCLQDLLPTSACRDAYTHRQKPCHQAIHGQVISIKWPHGQPAKIKLTVPIRILKLFDDLWLYNCSIQTQWTTKNLSTSSTQISRKPRSSIQTIPASP